MLQQSLPKMKLVLLTTMSLLVKNESYDTQSLLHRKEFKTSALKRLLMFTDHQPMLTSNSTGPSVDDIMIASKKHAKSLNLRLRKYGWRINAQQKGYKLQHHSQVRR